MKKFNAFKKPNLFICRRTNNILQFSVISHEKNSIFAALKDRYFIDNQILALLDFA